MPDREQLSLLPIELGARSPDRSDKARREAENISALETGEIAANRNEIGIYMQEFRKQCLIVEFRNQLVRI